MCEASFGIEVGYETLEFAYVYMCAFLAKHTVALALSFMGAYTSAYCRQVAAAVYYRHGIAEVAFGKFGNPLRNIVADGASFFAPGHLASQTSAGFTYGFRYGVVF